MFGPRIRLDHREGLRHGAAGVGRGGGPGQEVAGRPERPGVAHTGRGQRLQGDLDVDRQACRAAFVRFEAVAEAAVRVLIAAERGDHTGGRRAAEAGVEEALVDQPGLGTQKPTPAVSIKPP